MSVKKIIYKLFYYKLRKILRFKNLHLNEECVIFGDGASIKWFDLKSFSNYTSITVGYLPFHNDFKFLNCKYGLLVEPYWFFPFIKTSYPPYEYIFNSIQRKYREIINKNSDVEFFINLSNLPVLRSNNINYIFNKLPNSDFVDELIAAGINPFLGSFRASITIAIFMGFKTSYLVGFDYTHTPSRNQHWYEKGEGLIIDHENYEKEFIQIASKYINLTTITIDGTSTKLNFLTYNQFIGREVDYKENFEIIHNEYLEKLKCWKNYTI